MKNNFFFKSQTQSDHSAKIAGKCGDSICSRLWSKMLDCRRFQQTLKIFHTEKP